MSEEQKIGYWWARVTSATARPDLEFIVEVAPRYGDGKLFVLRIHQEYEQSLTDFLERHTLIAPVDPPPLV